jgi:hypothetical protein
MKKILIIPVLFFLINIATAQDNNDSVKKEYFYFFNTNPYNAKVDYSDSTLGLTPLRFFSINKLKGKILFRKEKFKDKSFNLDYYDFKKGLNIDLIPVSPKDEQVVFKNKQTQFNTKRNFFAIGGFGAAIITGLFGTIKFKNVANNSYDNYTSTLDQNEYDKSKKYDIYAGISLALMEAAFAGFIYYLFIDK